MPINTSITDGGVLRVGQGYYARNRVTSLDGTGHQALANGEFPMVKPGDISQVTCTLYQMDVGAPGTADLISTVPIDTTAFNFPEVVDPDWVDSYGRNFAFRVPVANMPVSPGSYKFVFTSLTTGGWPDLWEHTFVLETPGQD